MFPALHIDFDSKDRTIVCSRQPRPKATPPTVEFTDEAIGEFVKRLRKSQGKDIWLLGAKYLGLLQIAGKFE